jgi:hypothetical protein
VQAKRPKSAKSESYLAVSLSGTLSGNNSAANTPSRKRKAATGLGAALDAEVNHELKRHKSPAAPAAATAATAKNGRAAAKKKAVPAVEAKEQRPTRYKKPASTVAPSVPAAAAAPAVVPAAEPTAPVVVTAPAPAADPPARENARKAPVAAPPQTQRVTRQTATAGARISHLPIRSHKRKADQPHKEEPARRGRPAASEPPPAAPTEHSCTVICDPAAGDSPRSPSSLSSYALLAALLAEAPAEVQSTSVPSCATDPTLVEAPAVVAVPASHVSKAAPVAPQAVNLRNRHAASLYTTTAVTEEPVITADMARAIRRKRAATHVRVPAAVIAAPVAPIHAQLTAGPSPALSPDNLPAPSPQPQKSPGLSPGVAAAPPTALPPCLTPAHKARATPRLHSSTGKGKRSNLSASAARLVAQRLAVAAVLSQGKAANPFGKITGGDVVQDQAPVATPGVPLSTAEPRLPKANAAHSGTVKKDATQGGTARSVTGKNGVTQGGGAGTIGGKKEPSQRRTPHAGTDKKVPPQGGAVRSATGKGTSQGAAHAGAGENALGPATTTTTAARRAPPKYVAVQPAPAYVVATNPFASTCTLHAVNATPAAALPGEHRGNPTLNHCCARCLTCVHVCVLQSAPWQAATSIRRAFATPLVSAPHLSPTPPWEPPTIRRRQSTRNYNSPRSSTVQRQREREEERTVPVSYVSEEQPLQLHVRCLSQIVRVCHIF